MLSVSVSNSQLNSGLVLPRKTKISSTFDYNVTLKIDILESLRPKKLADFPVR